MTNNIITTDAQTSAIDSAIVELFELELNNTTTLYFYPGYDENSTEVKFHPIGEPNKNTNADASTYTVLPMLLEGIESTATGANNRPTISIANVLSVFRAALQAQSFTYNDLIGKKLTRRTTLAKFLVGGSSEDNPEEMPYRRYYVDRISTEDKTMVQFELASPFDVDNIKLPNRIVIGKYCSWEYQGLSKNRGACSWKENSSIDHINAAGNGSVTVEAFFDINDRPLADSTALNAALVTSNSGAWAAGTYANNKYVTHASKYWRSLVSDNSVEPSSTSDFWVEVIPFTTWANDGTYALNAVVRHSNKIWRKLVGTTSVNPEPGTDSGVTWKRIDFCGKTLNSCKIRYHAKTNPDWEGSAALVETTLTGTIEPSSDALPFGGFPGSVKFK